MLAWHLGCWWVTIKEPSHLALSGGSKETPFTFYLNKSTGLFLGEGDIQIVDQQRNASYCGPQPESNLFLTLAFWFLDM
jgi:hypothetical protein